MIEFRNVSMTYHTGTNALKDISFTINDGEFVFVIGRSGAGKSTLIKLLTCEERPSSGKVLIDRYDVTRIRRSLVPYLRRNIGMVFQDFRLIYTKTVFENVAFAMEIIGAPRSTIRRRVPIVLSIVGLRDRAQARPGELSGGEQQRVAIARAMVNNPMLILADEPTGNLDPANSEALMALLEEINRSGTTIVICTHDRDLVDQMQKRVIEIDAGYLVRDECMGQFAQCPVPAVRPAFNTMTDADADGFDADVDRFDWDGERYQTDADKIQPDEAKESPSDEVDENAPAASDERSSAEGDESPLPADDLLADENKRPIQDQDMEAGS